MNPLIAPIIQALTAIYQQRIKAKSTIDGVAAVAAASTISLDATPLPADSLEALIASVIMGLLGLYRIFKKSQKWR